MNSWTGEKSIRHLVKPITKDHRQQWNVMKPLTSGEANYKGSSPAMDCHGALNIWWSQLQRIIASNGVSWSPQHLVKPITKDHRQQWSVMEPSTSGEANYKGSSPEMESHGALNILWSQLQRIIASNGVSWSPQHLVKPIQRIIASNGVSWSPQHLVKPITKDHRQQWSLMEPSTSGEANYKGSSPAMESHGALNILWSQL